MIHFASTRYSRLATLASLVLAALVAAGCGGSSSPATTSPPPPPSLSITTKTLPAGQVGNPYSATLVATGGAAPYSWSLSSGTLPAGLSLNASSGALEGDPSATVAGVPLMFMVTDSSTPMQSSTVSLPLTIAAAAFAISTASLPNGEVGVEYSTIVAAHGGIAPYSWKLTGGTLPAGLSLNAASGAITGTPTASVSGAALTFTATDSSNPVQTNSATLLLTIAPPPLNITTQSLPYGQVNVAYSAQLAATGGTAPYAWILTQGTLPAGLLLSSAGLISGTPTATATQQQSLTFQVADAGHPVQKNLVVLTLPVSPPGITVSIPAAASNVAGALTITQTVSVSATTTDNAGVTWSLTPAGGSVSPTSSLSGVNVTLTAPPTAGVYTLTATANTNGTPSASMTVAVTDLKGVFTWHNDVARDGVNAQEYALTPGPSTAPGTVNTATFGKRASCTVDGAVYAQPLWVANTMVAGAQHNIVLVATQHDSLFAFDADVAPGSACTQLWQVSLIDSNHGGTGGETVVPSLPNCQTTTPYSCYVGQGYGDIQPEVGVTSTPVIDASGTLYVVSKSMNATCVPSQPGTCTFYQRLHAIDYTTGKEKMGSPVTISASYPGGNEGGTVVSYNARQQNQRSSLALVNGTVYVTSGSHEDTAAVISGTQYVTMPYYGWVIGYTYNGSAFTQSAVFCTTPNAGNSGIWMAGAAPAADSSGKLYLITANGQFDVTNASAPNNDYGDSFLQLTGGTAITGTNGTPALNVSSWFTPADQESDFTQDNDAGSGGAAVVLNLPTGSPAHLVIGGGKDGTLFLLNGDNMGGYVANGTNANAWESFDTGANIFSTGAFWNNVYYVAGGGTPLKSYAFNTATDMLAQTASSQAPTGLSFPGATPSVSASGATSNGIVWLLDNVAYCTNGASFCGPAVLHAYDATNLANELWNSTLVTSDAAGNAVKFTVPTVANGKVYVGTRGNNTGGVCSPSTPCTGGLDVYGLITK